MILVDANILLYTRNNLSDHHQAARNWWDAQLSGSDPVGLCWPVLMAFIRIGTNARLHRNVLTLTDSIIHVQSWLDQPCVRILEPTEAHWKIFQKMLTAGNATANLVTDAHLAALAIEHNAQLCSTDRDFARFPGLKWSNPIAKA